MHILVLILLGAIYWFVGLIMALFGCCGIGFALCIFVALFNIFRYKWAWALMLAYGLFAFICLLSVQGLLYLVGTIGDHTSYKMQMLVLTGLVFPGLISLAAIPAFIKVAAKQTRGLEPDKLEPDFTPACPHCSHRELSQVRCIYWDGTDKNGESCGGRIEYYFCRYCSARLRRRGSEWTDVSQEDWKKMELGEPSTVAQNLAVGPPDIAAEPLTLFGFRRDDTPEKFIEKYSELSQAQKEAIKETYLRHDFEDRPAEQHSQAALRLWRSGQHEQALNHYDQAVALAPEDSVTLLNRACLKLELGRLEDAMQDFERAQRGHPKLPDYLFTSLDLWRTLSPEARHAWTEKRKKEAGL